MVDSSGILRECGKILPSLCSGAMLEDSSHLLRGARVIGCHSLVFISHSYYTFIDSF